MPVATTTFLNKAQSYSILGEIPTVGAAQQEKKRTNVKPAQELIITFDFLKEILN